MQTVVKVEGRTWGDMHGEGLTLRVMVRSNVNTRNWTQAERPLARNDLTTDLGKLCEAFGGALAERQNEMYGDNHDPEQCAKAARKGLEEMLKEMESTKKLTSVTLTA